jgi:alkylation response protein AidB-like acyl-CoA dehydrogenase
MSDMHSELRDSARQVVSGLGAPVGEAAGWAQIVELGWLLTAVPEDLGGLGLGLEGACILHAELGRGVAGAPFLPAMLAIEAVCASDSTDKKVWLEKLTTSFSVTAPLAAAPLIVMDRALSGVAAAVQSADKATHVLICTSDHVVLAPLAAAEIKARPTWDETRRLFDVRFDGVKLEGDLVLARGMRANALGERLAAHRDFGLAADSAGGAAAVLEMTVEYLKARRQFGRPLALFQALKHRCADLKAQVSAAEALLLDQAVCADGASALSAAKAKQLAASVYAWVVEEAIQLHGGIAMTAEHMCHRYVKRALLNEHLGAPADQVERQIADSLLS